MRDALIQRWRQRRARSARTAMSAVIYDMMIFFFFFSPIRTENMRAVTMIFHYASPLSAFSCIFRCRRRYAMMLFMPYAITLFFIIFAMPFMPLRHCRAATPLAFRAYAALPCLLFFFMPASQRRYAIATIIFITPFFARMRKCASAYAVSESSAKIYAAAQRSRRCNMFAAMRAARCR